MKGLDRYLSPADAWALAYGCMVGWGVFVMPGTTFLPVAGLSGTLIYNYGGEIWNVVNIIDYHFLGDWESFSREWCAGYGNRIVLKPQLLGDHLRQRLSQKEIG